MSPKLTVHPLLFALFVAPLALPAPALAREADSADPEDPEADPVVEIEDDTESESESEEEEEKDEDRLIDDLASPFLSIGGGVGVVIDPWIGKPQPMGKVTVSAGFYVPMLYVRGGVDYTATSIMPFMLDGYAAAGVSIPVPVWHPMIGFKAGGGAHWSTHGWGHHLVYGPQIGWILRPYQKKVGIEARLEALVMYFPESATSAQKVSFTLSLVL